MLPTPDLPCPIQEPLATQGYLKYGVCNWWTEYEILIDFICF